jgi:hypothetical protein
MTEKKTKPRNNRIPLSVWFFCAVILADLLCATSAREMPYLLNMHKYWIYYACAFLYALAFFSYFVFFHKWGNTGRTIFQTRHPRKAPENSRQAIVEFAGLAVLSAVFAWMSWGIVAIGADWFSKVPFSKSYVLVSLGGLGGTGVDFGLVDSVDGNKYLLKQRGYMISTQTEWKIGGVVCAKGRTSAWGAIVEDLTASECVN